jgi:hypothetical protein
MISEKELQSFEYLVKETQDGMKKLLSAFVHKYYSQAIETDSYIVGIGNMEIALLAHMDTVHQFPVSEMFYDTRKDVLWSPQGLGADDRAGIYAILNIVLNLEKDGKLPHVIFTTDEELGGIGAQVLATIECPFPQLKYIIQLDRRGFNDCVFYNCDNQDFIRYVEEFGFQEAIGTYTDISFICPSWKVCGVNLSIGYFDEHTLGERLYFNSLKRTMSVVKHMLLAEDIPTFEYSNKFHDRQVKCYKCGKEFARGDFSLLPVKDTKGKEQMCCVSCLNENFEWCNICGFAYEKDSNNPSNYCHNCWEGLTNGAY